MFQVYGHFVFLTTANTNPLTQSLKSTCLDTEGVSSKVAWPALHSTEALHVKLHIFSHPSSAKTLPSRRPPPPSAKTHPQTQKNQLRKCPTTTQASNLPIPKHNIPNSTTNHPSSALPPLSPVTSPPKQQARFQHGRIRLLVRHRRPRRRRDRLLPQVAHRRRRLLGRLQCRGLDRRRGGCLRLLLRQFRLPPQFLLLLKFKIRLWFLRLFRIRVGVRGVLKDRDRLRFRRKLRVRGKSQLWFHLRLRFTLRLRSLPLASS